MKYPQNPRDAASPAPPSQQQNPLTAASITAPQQPNSFNARRNSTHTVPAALQSSPQYVFLRTPAVAISRSLINGKKIRNQRKCLKTIISTHF
jgi:hypothetical protein